MTAILGISAFYHDSAAALVLDGRIVAAAQEERFTRIKHDPAFPKHAVAYCLQEGGLSPAELDYVAFYDKPLTKFERLLETYLAYAPARLPQLSAGNAAMAQRQAAHAADVAQWFGGSDPRTVDLHRPSSKPRCECVFPESIRPGGDRDFGWSWRVEHSHVRGRRG